MKKYSIPDYKDNLTWGAKPDIFIKAGDLRKKMTPAEKKLWERLKNSQLTSLKFRRQHPIDIFIADFYCHQKRMIIELDGGIHDMPEQKEYDEGRSIETEEKGYKILRFKECRDYNNIEDVLIKIGSIA